MSFCDRARRSLCAAKLVGVNATYGAFSSRHPCGWPTPPGPAVLRAPPRATDVGVIALPKMLAVTPPSVIVCHRPANDVDKVGDNRRWHAGKTDRVEHGEAIQESMDDVVRYAAVTHRVDYRRQHVRQSNHRNVVLGTRFFVLRHAEAIAA
jgi:hypothetical protein